MAPKEQQIETRIIAVVVDNEPGVLARVIGLFSGRGYNIESLTVTEVDPENKLSRITVVTSGTSQILEQIKAQLTRLMPGDRPRFAGESPTIPGRIAANFLDFPQRAGFRGGLRRQRPGRKCPA